jgi:di/tricarboxylate transporter
LTLSQIEALAIVAGMLILFVSDRLRYDLVAALALSAAVLTGVVPAKKAFEGFSSSVIIIIASVLMISRAVAASGVIDNAMRRLLRVLDSTTLQVGALTAAVSFLSAFVKNVGALGVFMPVAIQAAERRNRPVSRYLMPLAFGSLVGGTITQIGTSPNVLISEVRQQVLGQPYHLFDYTRVGLPLTCMAVAFLSIGWRLLPANRRGQPTPEKRFAIEDYTSEALLPEDSPQVGKTVRDLEAIGEGEVTVTGIIREQSHQYVPRPDWTLYADDVLVLQGDPTALQPLVDQAKLKLLGAEEIAARKPRDKDDVLETVEAVVAPDSLLIGNTPQDLHLRQNYEVNLLALSRAEAHGHAAGQQPVRAQRRAGAARPAKPVDARADRAWPAAAGRAQPGDRPAAPALSAVADPDRRDGRNRGRRRAGRGRLLRRRHADRAAAADHAARGVRRGRMADHRYARLPDPGGRGAEGHRCGDAAGERADSAGGAIAGVSRGGPDHGGVDAGDAAAASRGGSAADGPGRSGGGEEPGARTRCVPDGGGVRRGV